MHKDLFSVITAVAMAAIVGIVSHVLGASLYISFVMIGFMLASAVVIAALEKR